MPTYSAAMSGDSRYILELDLQQTVDETNNRSTVRCELAVRFTGSLSAGAWTGFAQPWSRNYRGNANSGTWTYDFTSYSRKVLETVTITVIHNEDGTASFAYQATATMDEKGSATISGTFVLSPIVRGMVHIRAASTEGASVRGRAHIRAASTEGAPTAGKEVWVGNDSGTPVRSK